MGEKCHLCTLQVYSNVNHGHVILEPLKILNIKSTAIQHHCHHQVIIKFLLKVSHWSSEGNICFLKGIDGFYFLACTYILICGKI